VSLFIYPRVKINQKTPRSYASTLEDGTAANNSSMRFFYLSDFAKYPTDPLIRDLKFLLNIDLNLQRNSSKVLLRYGPLRRIFLCTIGHCAK
jgi:hypothetical protein